MNYLLVLLISFLLIGAGLAEEGTDVSQLLFNMEERYIKGLSTSGFGESNAMTLIFKGGFMVATGMAMIGTSTLQGADISPILWIILGLVILPVQHIIGILWITIEWFNRRMLAFRIIRGELE